MLLILLIIELCLNALTEYLWSSKAEVIKVHNIERHKGFDRHIYTFTYYYKNKEFKGCLDTEYEYIRVLKLNPNRIRADHTMDYKGYVIVKSILYWLPYMFIGDLLPLYLLINSLLIFISLTPIPRWCLLKNLNSKHKLNIKKY